MTRLSIEAFEDCAHPAGGYAVMLLRGLAELPHPAVFRLKIIDAATSSAPSHRLSAGNLEPSSVRLTADGVELVVGPDITACPQLLPGTAVEMELPAVAARGGFLWPSIAPPKAPRSKPHLFRPRRRDGEDTSPAGDAARAAASDADSSAAHVPASDKPAELRWQPHDHRSRAVVIPRGEQGNIANPRRQSRSLLDRSSAAMFIGAVAAGVLLTELALAAWRADRLPFTMPTLPIANTSIELSDQATYLFQDWSRAGSRSPRGLPVAAVSPAQLLERANQHLIAGPQGRDTDEGIFWLKHYLLATAGETITARALTQLGSAYAEPTRGAPDYERARHLWQVSAAIGDPLAMCFLATLFTKGLGVTANSAIGGNWLERARRAGGCGDTMGHGGFHEP